ncbi:MAG: sodium-translocating pyrophosphatase, partial [Candidatus Nitrosocaldus sp.]
MNLDSMLSIGASVASLGIAGAMAVWVSKQSTGSKSMMEISSAVRTGASAFLRREFITIMPIAIGLAIAISFASGPSNGIAFAVGAALSAIAGLIAMKITVKAAVRTAQATTKGLGYTLVTAFRGGATVGLAIPAMALIGVTLLYLLYGEPIMIAGVGIGASLIALFIRAGGGIFTKAADLGADLVGKIEAGIPEDDPRNPATIADNVGDNVGDAAGMGSDVYESYIVTLLAAMLLGALVAVDPLTGLDQYMLVVYPIVIGASGLVASIIGALTVTPRKIDDPMKPLSLAFMVSAGIAIALNLIFTQLLMGSSMLAMTLFATSVVGVLLVPIIQRITDYYTNYKYKPVKEIGESTKWGYAANMLAGIISGLRSTMPFMIAIVVTLAISYSITYAVTGDPLMGIYGTAIAAMAMLSLAGIVLSIDSFGPISDNAGGIVEMTGMGDENRKITDQIDAIGNTTKAVTKGFAIASAGLAALAMIQAFQHEAANIFVGKVLDYSLANPNVIIGLLVGGLLPFFISSQLIAGVNRAAMRLVDEVRSQFKNNPGILEGKAKPDYAKCIDIAT